MNVKLQETKKILLKNIEIEEKQFYSRQNDMSRVSSLKLLPKIFQRKRVKEEMN